MWKLSSAAVVGALVLAAAASGVRADPTSPTPAAQDKPRPAKTSDRDKVVCQTEEVTGSRLGAHRTCKTKAEWEQESQDSAAQFRGDDERDNQVNPERH